MVVRPFARGTFVVVAICHANLFPCDLRASCDRSHILRS